MVELVALLGADLRLGDGAVKVGLQFTQRKFLLPSVKVSLSLVRAALLGVSVRGRIDQRPQPLPLHVLGFPCRFQQLQLVDVVEG